MANTPLFSGFGSRQDFALKALSAQIIPPMMIGIHLLMVVLSVKVSLFPDSEVLSDVVSTCAEIIAGLYGITLAGYTFFLSRIDALTASDATLDYVVDSIKNRFKYLIWYITVNVLMTMLISIFLMCCPAPEGERIRYLYRLFCNEFLVSVVFSMMLILYYSILVIDPKCISREAVKLKRRLGGNHCVSGDVVDFIAMYDRIESVCNAMLPEAVLNQLHENKGKHFEYTLQLLEARNALPRAVFSDLIRIHRYYECVVNCSSMTVSQEMCLQAKKALVCLEQVCQKKRIEA